MTLYALPFTAGLIHTHRFLCGFTNGLNQINAAHAWFHHEIICTLCSIVYGTFDGSSSIPHIQLIPTITVGHTVHHLSKSSILHTAKLGGITDDGFVGQCSDGGHCERLHVAGSHTVCTCSHTGLSQCAQLLLSFDRIIWHTAVTIFTHSTQAHIHCEMNAFSKTLFDGVNDFVMHVPITIILFV